MRASPLGLRLFLEGVEVPVIAAQVNISPSQPATASIQIVPTDAALRFMPRTLVHLFYLDQHITKDDAAEKIANRKLRNEIADDPNIEVLPAGKQAVNRIEVSESSYKLLFVGEVVGITHQKTPVARNMVLQCMDLSSYWDSCYQWFADWSVHGNALTDKSHNFVGAGSGLFDNIASGTRWVISNILLTKPRTPYYRDCKGLLGGIISLLETVGGLRGGRGSAGGLRGVNDFFTVAERRYNFLGMVGAVEADKTSIRMYNAKAFRHWLMNGMSSLGNLISFRDIMRQVGQYIFHDVYPNPSAYLAPSKERRMAWKSSDLGTKTLTNAKVKEAYQKLLNAKKNLSEGVSAGEGRELSELAGRYAGSKVPSQQEHRFMAKAANDIIEAHNLLEQAIVHASEEKGIGTRAKARLRESLAEVKQAQQKTKLKGKLTGSSLSGSPILTTNIKTQLATMNQLIDSSISIIARLVKDKTYHKTTETGEHLFNQLILPETFFMPPPRCNVMFPDQYTEFTYSRNFMREITRLSCHGGIGILGRGNSKLLGRTYFAPTIKDAKGRSLYVTMRHGARILLPHEVHSGIIPKFEWVAHGHRWGVKAARKKGIKSVPYVQRLANFQFFMHRWAARTISMNSRFNPNLVLGLPALVVDRSAPSEDARLAMQEVLQKNILPTQYLGKVASIAHSLGQDGGNTIVGLTHCRTHKGVDDEFLGALIEGRISLYVTRKADNGVSFDPRGLTKEGPRTIAARQTIQTPNVRGEIFYDTKQKTLYKKIVDAIGPYLVGTKLGALLGSTGFGSNQGSAQVVTTGAVVDKDGTIVGSTSTTASPPGATIDSTLKAGQYPQIEYRGPKELKVPGLGTIVSVKLTGAQVMSDALRKQAGFTTYNENLKMPAGWKAVYDRQTGVSFWFVPQKIEVGYNTYETVESKRKGRDRVPIEEVMMPGWYSPEIWGADKIGEEVYGALLGCGSITDDKHLLELLEASKGYEDLNIPQEPTIEAAIDGLSIHYGDLKHRGLSVHDFIRTYTDRPIATLPEVMGGASEDGPPVAGFHSQAFGDYNVDADYATGIAGDKTMDGLFDTENGRVQSPTEYRAGGRVSSKHVDPDIPSYLDPRGNARARVRAYMAELNISRGLKGS